MVERYSRKSNWNWTLDKEVVYIKLLLFRISKSNIFHLVYEMPALLVSKYLRYFSIE